MFRPLSHKRRFRKPVSAALTLMLVLLALPCVPAPVSSHAAAKTAADDGQLPLPVVIAPGSAYRQTNLISDIPGFAPVQDPLLV
ncbi:MAG: hypothetical protein QOJ76_1190, partial [Acidobacteriota bacterium]|nr:hypothetical protein [Acidobacteriota bacterium]